MNFEKININDLFRYIFAGGVFIICFLISFKPDTVLPDKIPKNFENVTLVICIALLFGALIYSVHRAFLYAIHYKVITLIYYYKNKKKLFKLDMERWSRFNKKLSFQRTIKGWASQVHFLYCVVWAILSAQLFGVVFGQTRGFYTTSIMITATVIWLIAVFHHYRYIDFEKRIEEYNI
jgi:hypothetical protein